MIMIFNITNYPALRSGSRTVLAGCALCACLALCWPVAAQASPPDLATTAAPPPAPVPDQPAPETTAAGPTATATSGPAPTAPREAGQPNAATAGPTITLPGEEGGAQAPRGAGDAPAGGAAEPAAATARGASATSLGGYADLHFSVDRVTGPGRSESTVDFSRFVLFLAHDFTDRLRFYSELELEHAVSSSADPGEIELEQAYLDYQALGDALALRAGLVLVPMGIINQWHEPPTFHGVERPMVDTVIIPTTWREAAVGAHGEVLPGVRYQLYLMSGLNAAGFSAGQGLREGLGEAALARANGLAVAGRIEYEPFLSVVAGLSGYYGLAGPNANLYDAAGIAGDLGVPVAGVELDARAKLHGFEARAELAYFHIGDTQGLRGAADPSGKTLGLDVGSKLLGGYAELAYDALHALHVEQALLPFIRVEHYDTHFGIEGRSRTAADHKLAVAEMVAGITFRPVPQVSIKSDFRLIDPDGSGPRGTSDATGRFELGLGAVF